MITTMLDIYEVYHALERLVELMLMIFAPIVALTMLYITIGRPMLRAARRARLNEQERQLEHQKHLRYKYDRQYNDQSTKAGLEKQETIVEE